MEIEAAAPSSKLLREIGIGNSSRTAFRWPDINSSLAAFHGLTVGAFRCGPTRFFPACRVPDRNEP
jgi:hypothetical protein